MKTYMPLNGLRWSRNSGSANCDMPQSAVFGRPGGGTFLPFVLFFCTMAKCGQHNASDWGAAPTCQHRELGNSAQRPGLRSTRVRVQMPRGFGPTRERQRLPAGGGCADGQTALPATRLYSGANDAVRCIGQRSALHRLSQHAARAHAARCVWHRSPLSSSLRTPPRWCPRHPPATIGML